MADNSVITFEETEFEGNDYEIKYKIDVSACEPNEFLRFNIYIISNGGEVTIPVFIKVLKNIFYVEDGFRISSVKDLFLYSKRKPRNAVQIFNSQKFTDWLKQTDFKYMDILKLFTDDENKERGLENFFIFCRLKKRTTVEVAEKSINVFLKPFSKDIIKGNIVVIKKGYGYVHKKMNFKYNCKCIKFSKNELSSDDFDTENRCYIDFEIDPSLIENKLERECVIFDENTSVTINIEKFPKLVVNLSSEIYEYDDFGTISIENNCGRELVFEIGAKDDFIEFESKHYVISEKKEIPFRVKRSRIKNFMDRVTFNRKLYAESEIYIKTVFENQIIKKTKKIILGSSLFWYDLF